VAESASTFQWISFTDTIGIQLSEGDGAKNVTVKLRDSAANVSRIALVTITLDRSIPRETSVSINSGDEYTEVHQITLNLLAKNAMEMYISGDVVQGEDNFRWIPFQNIYITRLTEGEGEKTVRATFRNGVGNESNAVEAEIILDFTPPVISSVSAFNELDVMDNDLYFHSGQRVLLEALSDEPGFEATLLITALDHEIGPQSMDDRGGGRYTFLWNTEGLDDGEYLCRFTLEDVAGHSVDDTLEIVIDNTGPGNPVLDVKQEVFAYSRMVEVELKADGEPDQVFIAGDVVDDDRTFEWIPFMADEDGKMPLSLNLRGVDGEKNLTAVFRDKARSESSLAEDKISLELKRPEMAGSCRIIQSDTESANAYLALQFNETIGRIDPKNLFVVLKDKVSPQNVVYIDATSAEPVFSENLVMLEILSEQLDEIKQWQPMSFAASYIQAEISENGVFDLADKGNISNEQKPSDVYFVLPESSINLSVQPVSLSPNGDEVRDKITILYSPARTSDITIRLRNSQRETIKEWLAEDQVGGLIYSIEWDGKKDDNSAYPDGEYTVVVLSSEVEGIGFAYGLKQNFTIDNSPPQIVDIRPRDGERIQPLLRAAVGVVDTPESSGIEVVYITIDGDIENRLPLAKSETEGEYVVPSTSELELTPGTHEIVFHVVDMAGNEAEQSINYTVIEETEVSLVVMNFPNPFPPGNTTNIRYSLPEKAIDGEISIFDAGGDMVFFKELKSDEMEFGEHTFQWDGRNLYGDILARGVYFCRLRITTETDDKSKIHKIAIR
jgi:hypothetical protein